MAVDSDSVERNSRMDAATVADEIGLDLSTMPYPTVVDRWVLAAKQSADQYLNRDFDVVPEPIEQGIVAFVAAMLMAYLRHLAASASVGDAGGSLAVVASVSVGDQSITYDVAKADAFVDGGRLSAGYGPANDAGRQFWSSYRYHPLM